MKKGILYLEQVSEIIIFLNIPGNFFKVYYRINLMGILEYVEERIEDIWRYVDADDPEMVNETIRSANAELKEFANGELKEFPDENVFRDYKNAEEKLGEALTSLNNLRTSNLFPYQK